MKKLSVLILTIIFVISLSGCTIVLDTDSGTNNQSVSSKTTSNAESTGGGSVVSNPVSSIGSVSETSVTSQTSEITKDEALDIALKDAGVKKEDIKDLEIEKEKDDGIWVYEIEFEVLNKEYSFEIDVKDGKIIKSELEIDD